MRKAVADRRGATTPLSLQALQQLEDAGYKFVQVKGITRDKHYDYSEPSFLILVPIKELPANAEKKDIYEPVNSELLQQWANDKTDSVKVFISINP
jgi:hypothetical protein